MCSLGSLIREVGSSSLVESIDLAQRLDEAKLDIKKTRAKQKQYDELILRQAKMERTM